MEDNKKIMWTYIKEVLEEYQEKLSNNKLNITDRTIFSVEVMKDTFQPKEIKKYIEQFGFSFIERHKDLELTLGYLRQNDRFKRILGKIYESNQDSNLIKYDIYVFENIEI